MAQILSGKTVAAALKDDLTARAEALRSRGLVPTLAILRVGDRGDDMAYERGAVKRMADCHVDVRQVHLPADVDQAGLEAAFAALNDDPAVHGILVLQPLPKGLDIEPLRRSIRPLKDADGMSPINQAHIFAGDGQGFAPCTAEAVMVMLDYYGIPLRGKNVTIVGRSLVVGRPLAMLMLARNATPTVCHTKTADLAAQCRRADIVVACAGKAGMITGDMIASGAVVVDVGINFTPEGKLTGDVAYDQVSQVAAAASPVPGGVGSITTTLLARHVVETAERL
jgi:methylenetetrahydrofolate dehydrogenase (NADP+)/methenyltetrahydrofolate cyclohydrolase